MSPAPLVAKNQKKMKSRHRNHGKFYLFLFLATSGASEQFQALSCVYSKSARQVLSDQHKINTEFYIFYFSPLVALVSTVGTIPNYIQLIANDVSYILNKKLFIHNHLCERKKFGIGDFPL